MFRIPRINQTH